MTFDPARPRYTLPFNGKDYELLGDLTMIEAIETSLKDGIIQIAARTIDMGVSDTAKLLSATLTSAGYRTHPTEAGEVILNKLGVNSDGFMLLKMHLYAFLRIMMEPPETRDKMSQTMGEIVGKLTAPSASPGDSTKNSA